MFYIVLTKMEHQASTISLSFFDNQAFHKQASNLQAASAPVECSSIIPEDSVVSSFPNVPTA
jgi:hypothetical protein